MNSLIIRLALSFIFLITIVIGVITATINQAIDENFRQFLGENTETDFASTIALFEQYYANRGTWVGLQQALIARTSRNQQNQQPNTSGNRPENAGQRQQQGLPQNPPFTVSDVNYIIVASNRPEMIGRAVPTDLRSESVPLKDDAGETIGYFTRELQGTELALAQTEQAFLDDITDNLFVVSMGTGVFSMFLAILLAWWFARPLQHLKTASRQMEAGELGVQAPVMGASEIQEVTAAFNRMSAALAQSEAVRRQMFSDIAHELRTPIAVMRGQLEGMLDGVFSRDDQQIGIIYNQNLHLGRLVNDLWTLTRAETRTLLLEKEATNITDLLNDMLQAFTAIAQDEHIRLSLDVNKPLKPLDIDSGRIRQVFSNLLANAIRHTPAGGEISVSIEQDTMWTVINVADTGDGMSADMVEQIFHRFYRGKNARGEHGAGLGLAITRELIRLHDGTISVASTLGQGTTFTVRLPTMA